MLRKSERPILQDIHVERDTLKFLLDELEAVVSDVVGRAALIRKQEWVSVDSAHPRNFVTQDLEARVSFHLGFKRTGICCATPAVKPRSVGAAAVQMELRNLSRVSSSNHAHQVSTAPPEKCLRSQGVQRWQTTSESLTAPNAPNAAIRW